jgi:anthranilate phosphoribosyltransferase
LADGPVDGPVDGHSLADMWRVIVEFDDVLGKYIAEPIPVPERTAIVTGSGKETFKTFNVSTAAAILAVSAGARVVKGVSASVSAVSGAADVLGDLGIAVLRDPHAITAAVSRTGLAFIPYAAFCPRYAARYDGRFRELSPMSFFMPTTAVAIDTDRFVHGLAHKDVGTSAMAIMESRPHLTEGRVVTACLSSAEQIDEIGGVGVSRTAVVSRGAVHLAEEIHAQASAKWKRAVRHRASHRANAVVLISSLSPHGDRNACDLVERNGAVILAACSPELDPAAARDQVRHARESGRALSLLRKLRAAHEASSR